MSAVAEGGLVLNPGGGQPNMTSEKTGLGTNLNQGVPNVSVPQSAVFHTPLSTQSLAPLKVMDLPKIPSLMEIRPNVTGFPPPQPLPIHPPPQLNVPVSTHPRPVEGHQNLPGEKQSEGPSLPSQTHPGNKGTEDQEESGYGVCMYVCGYCQ